MPFPAGLRALNHPDFRRFYAAPLSALTGGWMHVVAQSWLVLQLTGSPLRLGLIGTLQFAPVLLLSIVSGAVADRLPKRRVLIVTQATLRCGRHLRPADAHRDRDPVEAAGATLRQPLPHSALDARRVSRQAMETPLVMIVLPYCLMALMLVPCRQWP